MLNEISESSSLTLNDKNIHKTLHKQLKWKSYVEKINHYVTKKIISK